MPWESIIMWVLSFILSKASGASTGKAALLATGAALATYYVADPANPDNLLGITYGESKTTPGDTSQDKGAAVVETSTGKKTSSSLGSAISSTLSSIGSWGPIALAGAAVGSAVSGDGENAWLGWLIVAGVAYLILK